MATVSNHTFAPGDLVDWGEMTVEIAFNPATEPPIGEAAEAIVISFADSDTTTWTFNGFMTAFSPSTPLEDRATASCTIKITGGITLG
jgi:hypothetical protein